MRLTAATSSDIVRSLVQESESEAEVEYLADGQRSSQINTFPNVTLPVRILAWTAVNP